MSKMQNLTILILKYILFNLHLFILLKTKDSVGGKLCLERCISEVSSWMHSTKLNMNEANAEFIIIGNKQQKPKCI